jgi:lipopolysaccharide/colanic/teichoic acid biosynthesis glycosyltransferase
MRTARTPPRENRLRLVEESHAPVEVQERAEAINRAFNVTLAVIALILLAPVYIFLAFLVKLTSRGPVFYSQTRVGIDRRAGQASAPGHRRIQDLGGQVFTIYKFRTMHLNAEHASDVVWASRQDPRVTVVGQLLRKYRLDELPQVINVLKGDMNIVGPRPEQPAIFANLSGELSNYRRRQRVLPGITGLAQITLPYDQDLNDVRNKVDLDLEYIRRRSVAHDLMIMAKTMPVMVMRKGSM